MYGYYLYVKSWFWRCPDSV